MNLPKFPEGFSADFSESDFVREVFTFRGLNSEGFYRAVSRGDGNDG